MIKNYLTVAFRNLSKHKVFSVINIFGLSIGIACCVLLALYIKDEFNYDRHFAGFDNIYRVTTTFERGNDNTLLFPRTSPPIGLALLESVPELESETRVVNPPEVDLHLLRYDDKTFYEKRGYLVDSTFFEVFNYDFELGDPNTALDVRSSVVLSHTVAQKIFRGESPLDKQIIINSGSSTDTFRITGVLKPLKQKSHLDADFYMNMNSQGWGDYIQGETTWVGNNFVMCYLKVRAGASTTEVIKKMNALLQKNGAEHLKEAGLKKTLGLQPLNEVRLYSAEQFKNETFAFEDLGGSGNILYIYMLGSICLFILLIACINFMNLTTAKASQRAGEVGVRKSLGASRRNLIGQFLGESMTIVVIAMVLSLGIVQLIMPMFNGFVEKNLSLADGGIGYIALALTGIALVTGLVAGSYPAFFLSAFQPAKVLKDKRLSGGSSNWLRKTLVVFQFVISICLISAILIIHEQLTFVQNKSLGFNPEYRIVTPLRTTEARQAYLNVRDRLKQLAGVKHVSGSTAVPSSQTVRDLLLYREGSSMETAKSHFNINMDEDYLPLLDIKLIAGRDLVYEKDSLDFDNNLHHMLVNEASLKATGLTLEDAVGSRLFMDWQGRHITFQVEGVVENFHQFSMHRDVTPMIFVIPSGRDNFVNLCVAVEASSYDAVLKNIEAVWRELVPNTPFEHSLLSEKVKQQYDADQRILSMITTFTLIAIVISCLGLYGLSVYVAERKVKEIGIRKVLGATVPGIVGMLSKDFVKLVAIAFVISVPVGYFMMDKWLQNFAYKIELGVMVFVLAGLISLAIAWATIGFESVKAAMGNPVNSLRNE